MYGKCETYGKRLRITILDFKKGFVPINMSNGLELDLQKRGLLNQHFLFILEVTTMKIIKVEEEIHERLEEFGKKNETFNDVIKRLLDNAL